MGMVVCVCAEGGAAAVVLLLLLLHLDGVQSGRLRFGTGCSTSMAADALATYTRRAAGRKREIYERSYAFEAAERRRAAAPARRGAGRRAEAAPDEPPLPGRLCRHRRVRQTSRQPAVGTCVPGTFFAHEQAEEVKRALAI